MGGNEDGDSVSTYCDTSIASFHVLVLVNVSANVTERATQGEGDAFMASSRSYLRNLGYQIVVANVKAFEIAF